MDVTEDIALGILLGASLALLLLTLLSYRRSGLRGLLLTSIGLTFQILLTIVLLFVSLNTDWLSKVDWWVVPLVDALVLVVVLVVATLGGRGLERSP